MANYRIQPIPVINLYERYAIHMDKAVVYDLANDEEVVPFLDEGKMKVKLITTDTNEEVILVVSDLVLNTIYGYTNCKPSREITEIPTNTADIFPKYTSFTDNEDGTLIINGIEYKQWLGNPYYANRYGAIFSLQTYSFNKRNRNEKGYLKVSLFKQSHALHRVVWECFNGHIPGSMEVDHKDNRRWHCDIDNLQLLTHKNNLDKIDINHRGGKGSGRFTPETICKVARDILDNMRIEDIAERYKVPKYRVAAIKYQGLYSDILKDNGIDLSSVCRQSKFRNLDPGTIKLIRKAYSEGLSQTMIAKEFGYSRQMINAIVNRKTWSNIPD